ncbi:hypothetical protein BRPE64_ACDS14910 [Caballeronia insecticola]|uniref:Uncharacterized protein n=1 Tax=Caballeronia insecticola TaxID=758793 RepID=R4WQR8_9BURK|nr:hypothetical protein BRPE64_ACDS14910 [Caballeronia insecticola]
MILVDTEIIDVALHEVIRFSLDALGRLSASAEFACCFATSRCLNHGRFLRNP